MRVVLMRNDERTILRVVNRGENPYFMMIRAAAQDTRLSLPSLGLLCYLLSKPDDWEINIKQLRYEWRLGRDTTYHLIRELKDTGYITGRERVRGQGGWLWGPYYVHESPQPITQKQKQPTSEKEGLHDSELPGIQEILHNKEGIEKIDDFYWKRMRDIEENTDRISRSSFSPSQKKFRTKNHQKSRT